MMKRPISALIIILILIATMPAMTTAQSLVERIDQVCDQLVTRTEDINARLDKQSADLAKTSEELSQKIDAHQKETKEEVDKARLSAKEQRFGAYKVLRQKADQQSESLAIEVFISSMEKAVSKRQSAFDKAVDEFRVAVRREVQSGISNTTENVANFRRGVAVAISDTETQCNNGTRLADVRQSFVNGLRNSRLEYANNTESLASVNLNDLIQNRNEQLKHARAEFESSVHELTDELKSQIDD